MRRIFFTLLALIAVSLAASAQSAPAVTWQVTAKMTSATEGVAVFKARIAPGWHLYGLELPKGGPKPTVIDAGASAGIEWTGALVPDRQPVKTHDKMFDIDLTWWDSDIAFRRKFKVTDPANARVAGTITYMGCNDETCLPPANVKFDKKIRIK